MPPEREKDVESRFAYLLQPIRDLAKNWDVNVASQLEDYISEVRSSMIEGLLIPHRTQSSAMQTEIWTHLHLHSCALMLLYDPIQYKYDDLRCL